MIGNPLGDLHGRARDLAPGCFAIVMATGIVSIDLALHGMTRAARALLVLNTAIWLWLLALLLWRCVAFPRRCIADFTSPARGPGFLTLAAGTLVLSSQFTSVVELPRAALALALFGAATWAILLYLFLAAAMVGAHKPRFVDSINGGWLVLVVATQAVAVACAQLGAARPLVLFAGMSLFMMGGALYLILITLLFYRLVFRRLRGDDLTPPYWINMGALAITTLAGSLLVLQARSSGAWLDLLPFLLGFTVFFWATASWWIPLLVLLGAWRHLHARVPLRFEPAYWNMVFPISMYPVGTLHLARALRAPALEWIPAVGVWVGLGVWLLVAAGGVRSGLRPRLRPGARGAAARRC